MRDKTTHSRIFKSAALAFCGLAFASTLRANPVFDWTELMIDAIRVDNSGPTLSTRNLALLHTSIFDAVNSIAATHQPYRFQLPASTNLSVEAAAVGAAHEIILNLYPGISARADSMLLNFQLAHSDDPSILPALALGRQISTLILAVRADDGSSTDVPYIPSDDPGMWRRTPPFFRPPVAPNWRYVDFFGVFEMEPYLPEPPPSLSSPEYAAYLNEVKALGAKVSSVRTAEQTQIAQFWSDFSYTSMPPGHWHLIGISIARERNDPLLETARLFALLSMAQADAAIVCWESKFRHNLWRPVTAIQRANEDNNPETESNPTWEGLLAAPPFPTYTSGHSTFSAASAAIIRHFYATDNISFTASADGLPGVTRSFTNLTQCVDEIGMSRIYGGIHFSFDNIEGKRSGRKIGEFISRNYLLPLQDLPCVKIENIRNATSLRVHGRLNSTIVTDRSEDLIHWEPVSTNVSLSGGVNIQDPSTANARFYRAREF